MNLYLQRIFSEKPFFVLINIWKYSYGSLERIPRGWVELCLTVNLPYCQYKNNYKISYGTAGYMPYKQACLISGCALVKLHCSILAFSENGSYLHSLVISERIKLQISAWWQIKENSIKFLNFTEKDYHSRFFVVIFFVVIFIPCTIFFFFLIKGIYWNAIKLGRIVGLWA